MLPQAIIGGSVCTAILKHSPIEDKRPQTDVLSGGTIGATNNSKEAIMAEQRLRVLVFGAHPDDCDFTAGGVAALYARQGHQVLFISVTNGDAGHYQIGGGRRGQRPPAPAPPARPARRLPPAPPHIPHGPPLAPPRNTPPLPGLS